MADDNKTRLVMLASEMKILKKVPDGAFDRMKESVPPEVWTNHSFARRWLLSGGVLPARQRKERVTHVDPSGSMSKTAQVKLEREARGAARDFVGDRCVGGLTDEIREELDDCARDLADSVLWDCTPAEQKRHRGWIADVVYDEIKSEIKKLSKEKRS